MMKLMIAAMLALLLAAAPARAQSIEDAAWLAGRWVGEGFGGQMEESWSPPVGGQMVGHFRHWQGDEIRFYEIMLMDVVEGGVRMRVKHFNPDFVGWEEKDGWHAFEPVSAAPEALLFNGLEIRRDGDDAIVMNIRIRGDDGAVRDEILRFRRAPL